MRAQIKKWLISFGIGIIIAVIYYLTYSKIEECDTSRVQDSVVKIIDTKILPEASRILEYKSPAHIITTLKDIQTIEVKKENGICECNALINLNNGNFNFDTLVKYTVTKHNRKNITVSVSLANPTDLLTYFTQ
jgi:hypothetical protein